MKKLDNRGFTLVELLAVMVILIIIVAIAVPSISSSLERTNAKQDKAKEELVKDAAELYLSDHKSYRDKFYKENDNCYIDIQNSLVPDYIKKDEATYKDGSKMMYIVFAEEKMEVVDNYMVSGSGSIIECGS